MGKTAAELMAELNKDEGYLKTKKVREDQMQILEALYKEDEKYLVSELCKAGFAVESVWDLTNSNNSYAEAKPILAKHLNIEHHAKILAGIARSLAVPEFIDDDELWTTLVNLYRNVSPNAKIDIPEDRGAQMAIAVALEVLATPSRVSDLQFLVSAIPDGDGIDWLIEKIKTLS